MWKCKNPVIYFKPSFVLAASDGDIKLKLDFYSEKYSKLSALNKCDKMTDVCFQYLAIFSTENMTHSIQIVPKFP